MMGPPFRCRRPPNPREPKYRRRSTQFRRDGYAQYAQKRYEALAEAAHDTERRLALMSVRQEKMTSKLEDYEQNYDDYAGLLKFYHRRNYVAKQHHRRLLLSKAFLGWCAAAVEKLRTEERAAVEFRRLREEATFHEALHSSHLIQRTVFRAWRHYVKNKPALEKFGPQRPSPFHKRAFFFLGGGGDDDTTDAEEEEHEEEEDDDKAPEASCFQRRQRPKKNLDVYGLLVESMMKHRHDEDIKEETPAPPEKKRTTKKHEFRLPTVAKRNRHRRHLAPVIRINLRNKKTKKTKTKKMKLLLRKKPSSTFGTSSRSSFLLPRIVPP